MIQFLLWSTPRHGSGPQPEVVAKAFERRFRPLFDDPPAIRRLDFGRVHLVYFSLPVSGWRPSFFQADDATTALGIAYPLNGHAVLAAGGRPVDPLSCLPELARAIQADPAGCLENLPPPLLMFWADKASGDSFLINDGLGHAQLYEAESNGIFALSNRLSAFSSLGFPLTPVAEEWAVKVSIGWFPLQRSGFAGIRFAEPSTLYHWGAGGLKKTRAPVLESWVLRGRRADDDCLEEARRALIDYIRATWPLFSDASGGLTGGFDSRAIFATYRHLGLDLRPRVKGPANNHDVRISKELARIAGLELTVKNRAELPPDSAAAVRRSIRAGLVWQAANLDHHKLIAFLPAGHGLPPGSVNVMGHDGFIGRGFFQHMLRTGGVPVSRYPDLLFQWFMGLVPPVLSPRLRGQVAELLRAACRQPAHYGVTDEKQLDFLYMFERSRRWSSGSQHSQTSLVLAPFLNPGYIRAVFSYRGRGVQNSVFHRHIISTHAPDWAGVVYERELKRAEKKQRARRQPAPEKGGDWRRSNNTGYFNRLEFWRQVGADLIDDSLANGSFWRQVYDPDRIPEGGFALGDELTMLRELEWLINS
jgi:hypothetical protein